MDPVHAEDRRGLGGETFGDGLRGLVAGRAAQFPEQHLAGMCTREAVAHRAREELLPDGGRRNQREGGSQAEGEERTREGGVGRSVYALLSTSMDEKPEIHLDSAMER